MNNLEWQNNIGMIAENAVVKNGVEVGVNLVIALRDSDYDNYKKLGFDWLFQEHKEPIKLKQLEYDLLERYKYNGKFDDWKLFTDFKEKGHFKGVANTSMKIKDILDNCIIVSDDYNFGGCGND